jgi:hypothetical protein
METRKVLKHTCFQQQDPLRPKRCRCRKYVTTTEAARLVKDGGAQYVVAYEREIAVEEVCNVCGNDEKLRRTCLECNHTGKHMVEKKIPIYGDDIIITVGSRGRKLVNLTAKKTPRSPTIERGHIIRANNDPDDPVSQAARERIEMWGRDTAFWLHSLGAAVRIVVNDKLHPGELRRGAVILQGHPEPEDDAKKGTGRRYDYGRAV